MREIVEIVDEVVDEMLDQRSVVIIGSGITAHNRGLYRRYFKIFTLSKILQFSERDVKNCCGADRAEIIKAKTAILNSQKMPFHNKYIQYLREQLRLTEYYKLPTQLYREIKKLPYNFKLRNRLVGFAYYYMLLQATCYQCCVKETELEAYIKTINLIKDFKKNRI